MFLVLILGESYVEGHQHVKVHIYIGNAQVRLTKDPQKVPQEVPKGCRAQPLQCQSMSSKDGQLVD